MDLFVIHQFNRRREDLRKRFIYQPPHMADCFSYNSLLICCSSAHYARWWQWNNFWKLHRWHWDVIMFIFLLLVLREKIPALHFSLLCIVNTTHFSILTLRTCWLYLCMKKDAWHTLALFCDDRSERHPAHIDTEATISGCLSRRPPEDLFLCFLVLSPVNRRWIWLLQLYLLLTKAARASVLKNEDSSTTFALNHFRKHSFSRILPIIFHLHMVDLFTS